MLDDKQRTLHCPSFGRDPKNMSFGVTMIDRTHSGLGEVSFHRFLNWRHHLEEFPLRKLSLGRRAFLQALSFDLVGQ